MITAIITQINQILECLSVIVAGCNMYRNPTVIQIYRASAMSEQYKDHPIWKICDQLAAELGKIPTTEQVRARNGGGSNSTIGPILRAWKQARSRAGQAVPAVPDSLNEALANVWQQVHQGADQRIVEIEAKAALELAAAQEEAELEKEGLRQQLASSRKLKDLLAQRIESQQQQYGQLTQIYDQYRKDRGAELDRLQGVLDDQKHQVSTLQQKLTAKDRRIEEEISARAAAERECAVLRAKLEQFAQDQDKAKAKTVGSAEEQISLVGKGTQDD